VVEAEDMQITEEDINEALQSYATQSDDPAGYLKALRESGQELALASDILRNRALDVILSNATPVDEDGNEIDLSLETPEVEAEVLDDAVEAQVVEAEILEEEE
jgi:FKBP-type peptidyl-prolyl cis-trans isomerase (trigger factor)